MKEMQFVIDIHASKEVVWRTLWQDETFRQWAGLIDPGTYMRGELREGSEVQFISAENGYGVTSLVEKCIENELVILRHSADTQEGGEQTRAREWTGGVERYTLVEKDDATTLAIAFDVPSNLEEYFKVNYPKALAKVKQLAEGRNG